MPSFSNLFIRLRVSLADLTPDISWSSANSIVGSVRIASLFFTFVTKSLLTAIGGIVTPGFEPGGFLSRLAHSSSDMPSGIPVMSTDFGAFLAAEISCLTWFLRLLISVRREVIELPEIPSMLFNSCERALSSSTVVIVGIFARISSLVVGFAGAVTNGATPMSPSSAGRGGPAGVGGTGAGPVASGGCSGGVGGVGGGMGRLRAASIVPEIPPSGPPITAPATNDSRTRSNSF